MFYLKIALNLILMIVMPCLCAAEGGMGVYRNSEYQFRFNYPSNWEMVQPDYEETVVEVSSPDNTLTFNVGVALDISLKKVYPRDFVKRFSKEKITEMYEKEFADFHLLDAGETTLSARPAYYFVYTITSYDSEKKQMPWKSRTLVTNRSEFQYSLTAGGSLEDFDKNRALIMSILDSFTISAPLWK